MKVGVFIEFFSGVGELGKQVAARAVPTLLWDIKLGIELSCKCIMNRSMALFTSRFLTSAL